MNVLLVGATGGTGRAAIDALLAAGHTVTAFARGAERLPERAGVRRLAGDVLDARAVDAAVPGHDAVVVTLGIAESPLLVRLGLQRTPIDVRSRGTAHVVRAMQRAGVRRLVVQSTYGVGASRGRLPLGWALIFALLLRPQIRDTEVQERVVAASGLDWTLVQPVGLVDAPTGRATFTSLSAQTRGMAVSRAAVAEVLAGELGRAAALGGSLAVSS